MKTSLGAGSILAGLTLLLTGCDSTEPKPAEHSTKVETPAPTSKLGPAATPAPIEPSPVPSLPPTGKMEEKKEEPKPENPK